MCDECLEGNDASFFEAVHALLDLDINVSFNGNRVEVISGYDYIREYM